MADLSYRELAKMIDHSLLHPTMTDAELEEGCRLAVRYGVALVCIKPHAVPLAAEWLKDSEVRVGTVAGFPQGHSHVALKVAEAERACDEGAAEVDMVVNIGKVLGGDWTYVRGELKAMQEAVTGKGAILKVIFENDYLQDFQIITLCQLCSDLDVAFVKTSTGYGFVKQPNGMYAYQGATDHHLKLMRRHSKSSVQIKAAGGVRTLEDLLRVRDFGVTRVGATATAAILDAVRARNRVSGT